MFSKHKTLNPLKVTIVTKVTDITGIFLVCHNMFWLLHLKGYRRYHSYSNNDDFSKLKIPTPLKVTIVTKVTDITGIFLGCHNIFWVLYLKRKVTNITIITQIRNVFSQLKILTPLKVIIVTKVTDITDIFSSCHNRYERDFWKVSIVTEITRFLKTCDDYFNRWHRIESPKVTDITKVTNITRLYDEYFCSIGSGMTSLLL